MPRSLPLIIIIILIAACLCALPLLAVDPNDNTADNAAPHPATATASPTEAPTTPAPVPATDWAGTYLKFAKFDSDRNTDRNTTHFGEAMQIQLYKAGDTYRLKSKPPRYNTAQFTEVSPGVLSDRQGGLGRIYMGAAQFADGVHTRILRADFCYEQFLLYDLHGQNAAQAAKWNSLKDQRPTKNAKHTQHADQHDPQHNAHAGSQDDTAPQRGEAMD